MNFAKDIAMRSPIAQELPDYEACCAALPYAALLLFVAFWMF